MPASDNREDLGVGLKPGDPHYRAYVGPPEDYDLIAAMTFNLLTTLGLRQHHSLLDVGCGSLRIGRLLIPYLNRGKYFGVEPNEWLVEQGIKRELGEALLKIKRPTFFFSDSPETIAQAKVSFDFALAQSIFSHCGLDLIKNWLSAISGSLAEDGALVATFLPGEQDAPIRGWVYPECVNYRPATMRQAAAEAGLRFELLDWRHPRQTWALFAAPKFDSGWFKNKPLTWNAGVAKALAKNKAGNVPSAAPAASADFSHAEGHVYEQDGLRSIHNHEFMDDPAFRNAYERGVRAAGDDYRWHWRVRAEKIAYLHLDMNCSAPEIAAIQFFWEPLVPGAFVLLDDYAYYGYLSQKIVMDQFAQEKGIKILSLPTGQGLLVKPVDSR